MKIALVTPFDVAHPGGVTEHVAHLRAEFLALGHEVSVLAPALDDAGEDGLGHGFVADGRTDRQPRASFHGIGRLVTIPTNGSRARVTLDPTRFRQVRALLARERFDIVHAQSPLTPAVPWLALLASKTVNVGTFHAYRPTSAWYAALAPVLRPVVARLHGRIAVSAPARRFIGRYFPGAYEVIPNGVDVARFNRSVAPLPWAGCAPTILFVGRHDEPRKGLPDLLRAMPGVRGGVPAARLVVVGAGDERKHARLLANLRLDAPAVVTFAGMVPAAEVPRFYASCDLVCSPATGNESFGIVLLEAMASGKPVVATDIPGYAEVLTPGAEGLLVPPADPDALAGALIRLLLDRDLCARFGAAGCATAARYAWPRVAAQVLDAYERARLVARADGRVVPVPIGSASD